MSYLHLFARLLIVPLMVAALVSSSPTAAHAHARYEYSEPLAGAVVDGSPFVLRAWFTQELMLRSSIAVVDENGMQVDLGDGRVDQDDPDRKSMVVSLPALPTGVYTVYWASVSAEDGDDDTGFFSFGVGMTPPISDSTVPALASDGGRPACNPTGEM